jgi:hypothetical protein
MDRYGFGAPATYAIPVRLGQSACTADRSGVATSRSQHPVTGIVRRARLESKPQEDSVLYKPQDDSSSKRGDWSCKGGE